MRGEMLNRILCCRFRHRSADDDLSAGKHEERDVTFWRSVDQSRELFRFVFGLLKPEFED